MLFFGCRGFRLRHNKGFRILSSLCRRLLFSFASTAGPPPGEAESLSSAFFSSSSWQPRFFIFTIQYLASVFIRLSNILKSCLQCPLNRLNSCPILFSLLFTFHSSIRLPLGRAHLAPLADAHLRSLRFASLRSTLADTR